MRTKTVEIQIDDALYREFMSNLPGVAVDQEYDDGKSCLFAESFEIITPFIGSPNIAQYEKLIRMHASRVTRFHYSTDTYCWIRFIYLFLLSVSFSSYFFS